MGCNSASIAAKKYCCLSNLMCATLFGCIEILCCYVFFLLEHELARYHHLQKDAMFYVLHLAMFLEWALAISIVFFIIGAWRVSAFSKIY